MEYWSAVLGGPRGFMWQMAQGKNVVANMEKHDNPNTHIYLKTEKLNKMEYLLRYFTI